MSDFFLFSFSLPPPHPFSYGFVQHAIWELTFAVSIEPPRLAEIPHGQSVVEGLKGSLELAEANKKCPHFRES